MNITNGNCITNNQLEDNSVDLLICDPPFGIGEKDFEKHYKRSKKTVTEKYEEAPEDYEKWTYEWLSIAKNKMKENATMYIVSGWSNLREVMNAIHKCDLHMINHLIWKFNFGVYTKTKYVSSHYHILMVSKTSTSKITFNQHSRFGPQEKIDNKWSALYRDMEDVFIINKEMKQAKDGTPKNNNKLPDELIDKLIQYSSNEGDTVCDFFMGNFTTAYSAKKFGRDVCGFELNKELYDFHMPKLEQLEYGYGLSELKEVIISNPVNQGKKITDEEKKNIFNDYNEMVSQGKLKKDISVILREKYGRGHFSIKNIIDSCKST